MVLHGSVAPARSTERRIRIGIENPDRMLAVTYPDADPGGVKEPEQALQMVLKE